MVAFNWSEGTKTANMTLDVVVEARFRIYYVSLLAFTGFTLFFPPNF